MMFAINTSSAWNAFTKSPCPSSIPQRVSGGSNETATATPTSETLFFSSNDMIAAPPEMNERKIRS